MSDEENLIREESDSEEESETDDTEEESSEEEEEIKESKYVEVVHKDRRWSHPIYKGWMSRLSSSIGKSRWKNRFFILNENGELWRFKNEKSKKPLNKKCVNVKGAQFWKSNVRRYCLEIKQDNKTHVFYGKTFDEVSKWVMKLEQAGGIFDNIVVNRHITPEISRLPVKKWSSSHVGDWLAFVPINVGETLSIYEEQFKNVDGKKLLSIDDSVLRKMRVKLFSHRRLITRSIKNLEANDRFDHDYHIVLGKLLEMVKKNSGKGVNFKLDVSQQHRLAKNLSQPDAMMSSYLHMGDLNELMERREAFEEIHTPSQSLSKDDAEGDVSSSEEEEEEEGDGELLNFKKELKVCDSQSVADVRKRFERSGAGIPVKLIITEVARTKRFKNARKWLSPIMSSIGKLRQEFGMFHSALLIGPWYLEWNDSSLVIPRRPSSNSALIAADIKVEDCLLNFTIEEMVRKISQVICTWNTRKYYDRLNTRRLATRGNCQEFVEDIMLALGINVEYGGSFGKFLKSLREKGTCEMIFSPSRKFRKGFKMKKKHVTFKTHQDLDKFVISVKRKAIGKFNTSVEIEFPWECRLLKSFDRAFWLRHLKNRDDPTYAPLPAEKKEKGEEEEAEENSDSDDDEEDYDTGCPFQDPRKTMTYM